MRIGFLGYDRSRTRLVEALENDGHELTECADKLDDLSGFDRAVSFGYRHLLRPAALASARRPVVNLHISLLPFNRGAHPNFWAHMERTPSGVTIHEIDDGVDTGPIIAQQEVVFPEELTTFAQTYRRLIQRLEDLFLERRHEILGGGYDATPQQGRGTLHRASDLPPWMTDWSMSIADARRLFDAENAR